MSSTHELFHELQLSLFEKIDSNLNGEWRLPIPDLMWKFGYDAVVRVRQSALENVLSSLLGWGINFRFTGGRSANDDIILLRALPLPKILAVTNETPLSLAKHVVQDGGYSVLNMVHPLLYLFNIDGLGAPSHSVARLGSLHAALWALRPICIHVDANDDSFSFLCGYITMVMRRRSLMVRQSVLAASPEIINTANLQRLFGKTENGARDFVISDGAVYILRQNPNSLEDDELVSLLRDSFIPDTFRLEMRSTSTDGAYNQVQPETDQAHLRNWFSALSGSQLNVVHNEHEGVSYAALLTEAVNLRHRLLDQSILKPSNGALRSGFESTEHIHLKSVALNWLAKEYADTSINVERIVQGEEEESVVIEQNPTPKQARNAKPDLYVEKECWVEIETLRGITLAGSNPFHALETKLRRKVNSMAAVKDVWLIVPSDIAVIATEQLVAIAHNLNYLIGANKVQCGFIDLLAEQPVVLPMNQMPALEPVHLSGIALRTQPTLTRSLTWNDIAGYTDVKERLKDDILDPLMRRELYRPFGVVAANGVLLYGLPGCGKSLIGQVIAGEANITCRVLQPSDLTSQWLYGGAIKIREIFDWALKQAPCVLVLDELDAVAPQRREGNMHTDEKRAVNELLAQLSRIADQQVIVIGTTNYLEGIDTAILRSGRFDIKLPVFPPDQQDRSAIFRYYLQTPQITGFAALDEIDEHVLAQAATLFTPADIKAIVHSAARKAIREAAHSTAPVMATRDIQRLIQIWPRSIKQDTVTNWIEKTQTDLGSDPKLTWLRDEVIRAYGSE